MKEMIHGEGGAGVVEAWKLLEKKLEDGGMTVSGTSSMGRDDELRFRYEQNVGLGGSGRPELIAWWYKSARPLRLPKAEKREANIGVAFVEWWKSLQPSWRGGDGALKRVVREGERWESLLKGGNQGIVTIMIGLAGWGADTTTREDGREFERVVADVAWVFGQMVKALDASGPQEQGVNEKSHGPAKRCVVRRSCRPLLTDTILDRVKRK